MKQITDQVITDQVITDQVIADREITDWEPGLQQKPVTNLEQQREDEERIRYRKRFRKTLFSVLRILLDVVAAAVLIATLLMPVMHIYGSSMTPTLNQGTLVAGLKHPHLKTGDVCAFSYENQILVKRVIAQAGDWVDIDEDGRVSVNGELLEEPYVDKYDYGECDITLPYQVPENRIFVMGDHRSVSIDSRSTSVGCVNEEQIVGKMVLKVWPLKEFGFVR